MLWWILGVLTGIGGCFLFSKIKSGELKFKAWHWICFVFWYGALVFTLAFVNTSVLEGEPFAGFMAALFLGLPVLLLAAVIYRFVFHKQVKG